MKDKIDQDLVCGDYVVYYNHIYVIKGFPKNPKCRNIYLELLNPSPTSRKQWQTASECIKLDKEAVDAWNTK